MKLFFDPGQLAHRPTQYLVHGKIVNPLEKPERAEALARSLAGCGLQTVAPTVRDVDAVLAVHPQHYVDFLQAAHAEFSALPNAGPEVLPNVHPYASGGSLHRPKPRTTGILGRAGWYIGDLSCAMMADTAKAALCSAFSAVAAADAVLAGAPTAFALCRPPGHHAYPDRASGFCFLNNAAIAAQRLRAAHGKVAIVDFDTHHGDGTQAIFYDRADVFFGSVHTDPSSYYPHYYGYADERGQGAGAGFNLNVPLAFGADDAAFIAACRVLADAVTAFGATALVLSAGWDAHHRDPLSRLGVTTGAYRDIARILAGLGLPTVIVQEGGYSLDAIAEIAPTFVTAFLADHRIG